MEFRGFDEGIDNYDTENICELLSGVGLKVIKNKRLKDCLIDLITSPTVIIARKPRNL